MSSVFNSIYSVHRALSWRYKFRGKAPDASRYVDGINLVRGKSYTHSKAGREAGGGGFDSAEGGIVGDECGDELAQRDGGRQRLVGQRRASERAGVVRAQPAEDLAPLVRVPV